MYSKNCFYDLCGQRQPGLYDDHAWMILYSYIEVAALQNCKCIKSHRLGLELGGCNNEVAA